MALWAVGALINIIGSVLINLGTNIIKLGHTRFAVHADGNGSNGSGGGEKAPRLLRQPRRWWRHPGNKVWLGGMSMFSVGNLLNFASFAFAAQSLLSALGVVQFISNIVFGRLVNKERVTRRVLGATAVVCTGCVLLVAFGNHESPTLSTHDMLQLYSEPLYITYLCCIFTASPLAYAVYRRGKRAVVADFSGSAACRWARWLPISYALFAGPLGTQSVMYGKTISMLLRTTFSGDSQLGSWYTWVSLMLFVLFAGFWMSRYSKAMKLFPVLIIMPIIQIVWILFSMISGSIYFQEYKTLTALSGTMFGLGVVIQLAGVWLLTGGKPPAQQQQALQPDLKVELAEEGERERAEDLSELELRGKSPLSNGLEGAVAQAQALEPEEALVARKLSTVYEQRRTPSAPGAPGGRRLASLTSGGASGPGARRTGSAASRRSVERGGESQVQLMEEGVVDSAAGGEEVGTPSPPPLRSTPEPDGAGAATAAGASPPPTSLMHDIVSDWGVGMRDLNAVMRASVGVYQDEDETTAFSIWSMPIATSFTSAGGGRYSMDGPRTGTFRVRQAFAAQLGGARPPSAPSAGAALDDGTLRSTRPGHRRLNRSRSANELGDMLRQAAELDQLELAMQHSGHSRGHSGLSGHSGDNLSPWRAASSAAAGTGASPPASYHLGGTPSSAAPLRGLHAGSAPVLSAVLIDSAAGAAGGGGPLRGPMLSTPGSAPRRPLAVEPPQLPPGLPVSPAFSGSSQVDESEGPADMDAPAAREGGAPISDFLSLSLSPSTSADTAMQLRSSARKGDKAA